MQHAIHTNLNDDAVLIEIANLQNYQVYLLIQGYLYPMYVLFVQCLFLKPLNTIIH